MTSPYLAQALQQMAVSPQPTQQGPDLAAMQRQIAQKQAWQAANPGQDYGQHVLQQFSDGLSQAPGRIMKAPGNMARGIGGLFGLGQAAQPAQGAMPPQSPVPPPAAMAAPQGLPPQFPLAPQAQQAFQGLGAAFGRGGYR